MSHPSAEKEAFDVCILELLNIAKPLKESCFSQEQIDMLFNLWREFMYERFKSGEYPQQAREDVDRLYSNATTVKRKYNALRLDQASGVEGSAPALASHETDWVMGDDSPTPFIKFLRQRPQVIEILRMCFKPNLMHGGMLEAPDFVMILLRYIYWLKDDRERKLNVLGVADDYNGATGSSGTTTDSMVGNLKDNWSSARFHLTVINEDLHWRAVLIDRKHHSFEYYDPKGHGIDLTDQSSPLSVQVAALYETTRALDDQIVTKSMHSIRRGFHKHQTGGTECGMYVVMFIHSRVAQGRTFEHFAETEISTSDCKSLKEVFFTVPGHLKKGTDVKTNKDYRIKFGAYDIRLAALEFVRYMAYVLQILDTVTAQQTVKEDQKMFLTMAASTGDYIALRVEGMKVQKDVLSVLPSQFKTYAGSDIWFSIIQEVVQDPLTKHLRKISSERAQRSRNTVRKKIALKIFNDVVGWSLQPGAPQDQVQTLEALMRDLIDNYYVLILRFDQDNHKRFMTGMLPAAYIRECMSRQESVSFGVHFLREVNNYVTNMLKYDTHSELNTKYAVASLVVKPVSIKNIAEIKTRVNQCDQAVEQAYQLLRSTFTERMMITNQVRSPNFGPAALPVHTNMVQPQLLEQIIQLSKKDIDDKVFLSTGLQPWNFPLDVVQFNASQSTILPENFNLYSVNDADMRQLLTSDVFKLYYSMGVLIGQHYIATGLLKDVQSIHIMLISLVQFYNVTQPFTDNRKIMCTLLNQMYNAVNSPAADLQGVQSVLEFVSRFQQACVTADDINASTPFFQRVNAEFQAIFQR